MTMATSAFSSFAAIGNREDISDTIYRIDPTDTPFFSGVEKAKASAVNHEWQTQALRSAAANAQLEGDDITAVSRTPTVRLGNICQILYTSARVTGTQRVVDHAGRDDEMAYQEMLAGLELKRDIEYNLVGLATAKVSGATTTARKFASVMAWITTNTDKRGGTAADPTAADGTSARVDSATLSAFTEARLKNVIKKCFDAGGKPTVVMLNSFNKQQFSTFTGRSTPMEQASTKGIVASVDWYQGDFTRAKVVANRQMRGRDCLILQTDMWALAHLPGRNMAAFDVAKTGDADQRAVLSEYCLVSRNEKASAGVFDLTSS